MLYVLSRPKCSRASCPMLCSLRRQDMSVARASPRWLQAHGKGRSWCGWCEIGAAPLSHGRAARCSAWALSVQSLGQAAARVLGLVLGRRDLGVQTDAEGAHDRRRRAKRLLPTCCVPTARAWAHQRPGAPAAQPLQGTRSKESTWERAHEHLAQLLAKKRKEKTTLAVTATVSDSTAGISLEEAE